MGARQHHQLLGELAVEATSAIPSVLPDFTASPLSVLNDRVLWLVIAEADAGNEFRSSPFTIPGCSEAACLRLRRPSKTALSKDCWKLALRGWKPRSSCVLGALFLGETAMSPREWKGPVVDKVFHFECSPGHPIICGFVYRVIPK